MKRIISIILCFVVLLAFSPQTQQEVRGQAATAIFVVGIVAVGIVATIWIMQKYGENKTRYFVLDKGYLDGNWTPVATNALRVTIGHAIDCFEVYMTDPLATYRVREIPRPTNYFNVVYSADRLENPIVQAP